MSKSSYRIAFVLAVLTAAFATARGAAQVTVRVDSSHHQVIVVVGPWDVPGAAPGASGPHAGHTEAPTVRFVWPVDGWVHGVRLRILDARGTVLSRRLIHHVQLINFSRRELEYPAAERLAGFGGETDDLHLPASIGVPVSAGMAMAIATAWRNPDPAPIHGVRIEFAVDWLPTNFVPRPVSVLPVALVVIHDVFEHNAFDLPPGPSTYTRDFPWTVSGRVLAVGGHLHDYGISLTLLDASTPTPRRVLSITSKRDSTGHVLGVSRLLPGAMGSGTALRAGRTYRVVGSYQNTSGAAIAAGAMSHLVVLFAPDHLEAWPAVDSTDPRWKQDQDIIFQRDMAGMDMSGGQRR